MDGSFPVNAGAWSASMIDADTEFRPPLSDQSRSWPDLVWQNKINDLHAQLMAIRTKDLDWNVYGNGISKLANTRYMGLIEDPSGGFYGAISDLPDNAGPDVIAAAPSTFDDGYYGAHEIAHALGMKHPGFCGQNREDCHYPFEHGRISGSSHFDLICSLISKTQDTNCLCNEQKDNNQDEVNTIIKLLQFDKSKSCWKYNREDWVEASEALRDLCGLLKSDSSTRESFEETIEALDTATEELLHKIADKLKTKLNAFQHHEAIAILCDFRECMATHQGDTPQINFCILKLIVCSIAFLLKFEICWHSNHVGYAKATANSRMKLKPHGNHYDLMTYCDETWISPYTYKNIREKLSNEKPETIETTFKNLCIIGVCNVAESSGVIKHVFNTRRCSNESHLRTTRDSLVKVKLPMPSSECQDFHIEMRSGDDASDLHADSRSFQLVLDEKTIAGLDITRPFELIVNKQLVDTYAVKKCNHDDCSCNHPNFTIIRHSLDQDLRSYFYRPETADKCDNPLTIQFLMAFDESLSDTMRNDIWFTAGVDIHDDIDLHIDTRGKLMPNTHANAFFEAISCKCIQDQPLKKLRQALCEVFKSECHREPDFTNLVDEDWFICGMRILNQNGTKDSIVRQGILFENPLKRGDIIVLEMKNNLDGSDEINQIFDCLREKSWPKTS